ncbi:MAG: gas vesicle protein, partial [Elusimicrobia bacterium]|nr:gas vesicle protein [Elusimicrobiota bacterium]
DLLTIKIRLVVCSVDKAMEMGINWWQQDSFLSTEAKKAGPGKENAAPGKRSGRPGAKIKTR